MFRCRLCARSVYLTCVFIHLVKFSKLVGSLWEIAARAHCNMFSLYKSFSHLGFQGGAGFDLTILGLLLTFTFSCFRRGQSQSLHTVQSYINASKRSISDHAMLRKAKTAMGTYCNPPPRFSLEKPTGTLRVYNILRRQFLFPVSSEIVCLPSCLELTDYILYLRHELKAENNIFHCRRMTLKTKKFLSSWL